jgi:di-N-acetylchitobiase
MTDLGLDGFNIDIEQNHDHRDDLTSLIKDLSTAVRAANPKAQLSFDLAISPKGQTSGYVHADLAAVLDFIVPMAYDECWGAKAAAANSPISSLSSGVEQYLELGVGPEQLVLGLPWYGWDFPCDSAEEWAECGITVPDGKEWYGYTKQISYIQANHTATHGHETKYDDESKTAYTEYVDEAGQRHQRWFDNPMTLSAKYAEAAKLGVKGVAFWTADHVDYTTDQGKDMWDALRSFPASRKSVFGTQMV